MVYYLPDLKGQKEVIQQVAGGWELAAITSYASGTSGSFFQDGVSDLATGGTLSSLYGTGFTSNMRPMVSGEGCYAHTGGAQVLNPHATTLIGYHIGTFEPSTEPRGYCHGPGFVSTDFSVDKNWRVWGERLRIQFRMDFFNLFNHPNFRGDQVGNFLGGGAAFSGVNCGPPTNGVFQPCSPTNNIITNEKVNSSTGKASQTRGAREIQYGLKIIF
jgi:hypothetical protein